MVVPDFQRLSFACIIFFMTPLRHISQANPLFWEIAASLDILARWFQLLCETQCPLTSNGLLGVPHTLGNLLRSRSRIEISLQTIPIFFRKLFPFAF